MDRSGASAVRSHPVEAVTDSRRIIGAETALAVLMDAAMRDEAFFDDLTERVTVESETVEAVLAGRLRPRWQVNTDGTVEFWLEGETTP